MVPIGCYKFEQPEYQFDTSNPATLVISTTKYLLKGRVLAQLPDADSSLKLLIR